MALAGNGFIGGLERRPSCIHGVAMVIEISAMVPRERGRTRQVNSVIQTPMIEILDGQRECDLMICQNTLA